MIQKNKTKGFDVKDIKPFYLTPKSVSGSNSIVSGLKNDYGLVNDGIRTFKTGIISTNLNTDYNERQFSLMVDDKGVRLLINELMVIDGLWTINSITKELKKKNPDLTGITQKFVKSLILNGDLVVKFNVVKKDHGTRWFINRQKSSMVIKPKQVVKEDFKMIPKELYSQLFHLGRSLKILGSIV